MQLWGSWSTLSNPVLCFLYSTVYITSPTVENYWGQGPWLTQGHWAQCLPCLWLVLVLNEYFVECMKNIYWIGDLPQIMTVHRIWEVLHSGSLGFHGNSSASDCSIHSLQDSTKRAPRRILVSLTMKPGLCWQIASDQLLSLGLRNTCRHVHYCTMNRKHGKPGAASLLI